MFIPGVRELQLPVCICFRMEISRETADRGRILLLVGFAYVPIIQRRRVGDES